MVITPRFLLNYITSLFSLIYFRNLLYNIVKHVSKSGVSMNINTTYTKIITGADFMETAQHGSTLYPFQFYYEDLSVFDFNCIEWHWHTELEFIYIESGTVTLWIGEDQFHLTEGNGVFINTKVLHRLYSPSKALIPNFVFMPAKPLCLLLNFVYQIFKNQKIYCIVEK